MKITRIITAVLVLTMILPLVFASCVNPGTGNEENESESSTDNVNEPDSEDSSETTSEIKNDNSSEESEMTTTEKIEETTEEEITDEMIGDTIEAEPAADFSVSRVFSNDMVVQRNEHIRVWGFAPESENGKKVSGEFKGMFAEALIENGEWCLTFGARLEADTEGAEMKIYAGENKTVTFTGVLVGDVYLVLGQSNAAYTVNDHLKYNDPQTQGGSLSDINESSIIRLNHLNGSGGVYEKKGTNFVYSDLNNTKLWTKTTQQDTLRFSALGYYFAVQMTQKDPTVPIGLMEVAVGGAPLVSFLPNDLADKFGGDYKDSGTGIYYSTITKEHMGRYLYNCYLAPVSKYAVAGVLWYQGESNNSLQNAMNYNATFAALMTRLRSTHNVVNKNFPVFVVEFPSIYKKPANYTDTWHFMELGTIRSFMGTIPSSLKNSYVAVSNDLWSDKTFNNSLHPNCKYEQAERLAALADAVILGNGTLDTATGPIFESITISSDNKTVTLTFTNVGDGLTTKDGGKAVKGLVGFGAKTIGLLNCITPKSAEITAKNQITVTFDEEVKCVAYNFLSSDLYGETLNLCNSNGCPASAFVTPYEEIDLDSFETKSFLDKSHGAFGLVGKSFDSLTSDGVNVFSSGSVETNSNAGNKIVITKGTGILQCRGWIGFKYDAMVFGYSIDGGNAVLNAFPIIPEQAVINAGGAKAVRFSIQVDVSELSVGDHTITFLALVDVKEGIVAKLLTFTVTITEPTETPENPEVQTYRPYYASEYGLMGFAFDMLKVDNTTLYTNGGVLNQLRADNNTVTVKKGSKQLYFYGWIGYPTTLDKFGCALDGVAKIDTPPSPETVSSAVIAAGGENAKRYGVYVDISGLDVGEHTCDFLVRINTKDGQTATLLIHSFTLIVTE